MKKLLFVALIFQGFTAAAQVDTTLLRSGKLTLRVNDWEYIAPQIAYNATYENLYDSIKAKLRFGTYPTGATQVTVDSITNGELVNLYRTVKTSYNAATATAVNRILSAIKAMNPATHYVNRMADQIDTQEADAFTQRKQLGKNIYRKQ